MPGTVHLVGAGPGAPDLLTLRAARLLGAADIVFHDALVHPDVLALATRATLVAVGKRCGRHSTAQRFINKRLVDAAFSHATVVRLKGGDPMLFARAEEELSALRAAGVRYEVVPGVSAAFAAAADLGVPLTERGVSRSVAFVTPRVGADEKQGSWTSAASHADTVVVYMGRGEAEAIRDALVGGGRCGSTPVALVEDASLPGVRRIVGRLHDLPRLAAGSGEGPAIMVVGDVLRDLALAVESETIRSMPARA